MSFFILFNCYDFIGSILKVRAKRRGPLGGTLASYSRKARKRGCPNWGFSCDSPRSVKEYIKIIPLSLPFRHFQFITQKSYFASTLNSLNYCKYQVDSKRLWRKCVTLGISGFLDFVQLVNYWSSDWGYLFLTDSTDPVSRNIVSCSVIESIIKWKKNESIN
jgi:hypothetical protein